VRFAYDIRLGLYQQLVALLGHDRFPLGEIGSCPLRELKCRSEPSIENDDALAAERKEVLSAK
jgi:hypothetical protein